MLTSNNSLPVLTTGPQNLLKKPFFRQVPAKSSQSISPNEILFGMKQSNLKCIYKPKSKYTNYRKLVIDWTFEVGEHLGLCFTTILIAIRLLDSIALKFQVGIGKYNHIAGIALIIAGKFQEFGKNTPKISSLLKFFPELGKNDLKVLEKIMLDKLNWDVNIITPMHYVEVYSEIGVFLSSESGKQGFGLLSQRFHKYCEFFVDLCIQEIEFLQFDIEHIAGVCIAASRKTIGLEAWPTELGKKLGTNLNSICFKLLWGFYSNNFANSQKDNKENQKL